MVELLVAMAVGVAVFMLILAILDQTSTLSERSISQESLWRDAVSAAQTIEQALQGYASPRDLGVERPDPDQFGPREAAFYSVGPWSGAEVLRIKIGVRPDEDAQAGDSMAQVMTREPVGARVEARAEGEREIVFGSEEAAAEIRFRYAYKIGGNLDPVWTEEQNSGTQPLLVEYRVTVSSKEPSERMPVFPVQLTGAVALGN